MSTTNGLVVLSAWAWRSMLEEAIEGAQIAVEEATKKSDEQHEATAKYIFNKKRFFWERKPTIEECRTEALRGKWRALYVDSVVKSARMFQLRVKQELTDATIAFQRYEVKEYHIDSNFYSKVLRHGKKFREIEALRLGEKDAKPTEIA